MGELMLQAVLGFLIKAAKLVADLWSNLTPDQKTKAIQEVARLCRDYFGAKYDAHQATKAKQQ